MHIIRTQRTSTHTPQQAPPLTPQQLQSVITYLMTAGPAAKVLMAALLISPAFITPDGVSLLPAALIAALRMALAATRTSHPAFYTIHSLRQGGAQACAAARDSLQDIMALVSWTSAAVHTYIPKEQIWTGPRTLSNLLG